MKTEVKSLLESLLRDCLERKGRGLIEKIVSVVKMMDFKMREIWFWVIPFFSLQASDKKLANDRSSSSCLKRGWNASTSFLQGPMFLSLLSLELRKTDYGFCLGFTVVGRG